eukprot:190119-Chlamydomonas_euryale.AAC.3
MVCRRTLQWMGHVLQMGEDRLPQQVYDCSLARSVAEDGRVEQLKSRPGHRSNKDFYGIYTAANRGAMRKVPVVAPLLGTSSSCLATLNWSLGQRSKQRRRNVPWTGRPGETLLKTLLHWNLRSPDRLDI